VERVACARIGTARGQRGCGVPMEHVAPYRSTKTPLCFARSQETPLMCSCGLQPATPYWSRSSFCKQVARSCRGIPSCFVLMLRYREAREVFGTVALVGATPTRVAGVGFVRTASACLKSHMSWNAPFSMYGVSSMATFHGLQLSTIHCDSMWVGRYGSSSSSSARRRPPGRVCVSGGTCVACSGGMDHAAPTGLARFSRAHLRLEDACAPRVRKSLRVLRAFTYASWRRWQHAR